MGNRSFKNAHCRWQRRDDKRTELTDGYKGNLDASLQREGELNTNIEAYRTVVVEYSDAINGFDSKVLNWKARLPSLATPCTLIATPS